MQVEPRFSRPATAWSTSPGKERHQWLGCPMGTCSILMWLTSLAIWPSWHSQAGADASERAVACECSSPTLPVDPRGMAVVVVEALGYGCSSPTLPLGP
jgi:hypothetical protein